jgi:hypothetical protein
LNRIFSQVLSHQLIKEKPPVLVDIGASGNLVKTWKIIAPYATCIAFDADDRDFMVSEIDSREYKNLYLFNRVVAENNSDKKNFYLTRSPHCSSLLEPNSASLDMWSFRKYFEIEKVVKLEAMSIADALNQCNVDYIDWYKTDTQGIDLRIFESIPGKIQDNLIVADFEPGIIDAYYEEDKLHKLMLSMDEKPFWVSDMIIKGSHRIKGSDFDSLSKFQKENIRFFLKTSPAWAEISYFNKFENEFDFRRVLLGWLFATLKKQHGFALYLATIGCDKNDDSIFIDMRKYSMRQLCCPSISMLSASLFRFIRKIVD